ncbi:MAG: hypothetical protein HQL72_15485 [Magnetococcales bacterium]|nr:hypothetical protein [Magnetococcales bacterium]
MAATETLLFKINGINQTSQLPALAGKSFTVGNVSTTANGGLANWLFLTPTGSAAGQSSVALKIEGTNQIAHLSSLAGKSVTVGKSPAIVGGTGKMLLLTTGKGTAVAATGAAAATAAQGKTASEMVLVKLEGGRQAVDFSTMAGKTFTVMKPPMMGGKATSWMFLKPAAGVGVAGENIVALNVPNAAVGTKTASSMIGKSFTISKAPLAAGAGGHQWLAFKPVAGVASKGMVATTVALKGNGIGAVAQNSTTIQQGVTGSSLAGTGNAAAGSGLAGKSAVAAKAAGGGTIWNGTGMSLGLGLGLGAWGPVALVGVAAVGVGIYGYLKNSAADGDEELA